MNRLLILLAVSVFLSACATTTQKTPPVLQKLAASGIDSRTYAKIAAGRVLDYAQADNRQLCRLYLSMMAKMGVRERSFGDATEPLAEV